MGYHADIDTKKKTFDLINQKCRPIAQNCRPGLRITEMPPL